MQRKISSYRHLNGQDDGHERWEMWVRALPVARYFSRVFHQSQIPTMRLYKVKEKNMRAV